MRIVVAIGVSVVALAMAGVLARGESGEAASSDVVVIAAGDIACDPTSPYFNNGLGTSSKCRQKYTAQVVTAINPDAVLGLGDFQYEDGLLWKYKESYAQSWGAFKAKTYTTAGGEHDQYGGGDYYTYFGTNAGPQPYSSFSFDLGSWHIVSMNSNCSTIGGCSQGSRWEQWLTRDLAAHPTKCTLAFWHHPRWSSGKHGNYSSVSGYVRALYRGGADVLLVAHDHDYERFAPQRPDGTVDSARGIREFVVGTGGKSLYSFGTVKPNSRVRQNKTYGVLKLVLHPTSYEWRFLPETAKPSSFTDSGSASCH